MSSLLSSVLPSQSVSTNSIATGTQLTIPEKDEIWSGILKGVASSKIVPTKNVLVLGEPGVGKSTLVHYLKNDPGPQIPNKFEAEDDAPFKVAVSNHYTQRPTVDEKNDLALGYTFAEITDEEHETMARLGIYQLGLASPEFLPLLKFALRAETMADSCVLILLDWTRPWKFLETLQRWINVLGQVIAEICKEGTTSADSGTSWSKGKAVVDELREKLEHYWQTYTEPSSSGLVMTASTSTSSVPSTVTSTVTSSNFTSNISSAATDQVVLPLSPGCLTNNLGIPITIVCCKSDAINGLEQTHDFKDDQFDYIQQTLRCICMKYGASLFYTSTLHPYTFHHLREYILHRVLSTPAKSYPFQIKAQTIERDTVLVPSGWDSWGKIKVLREGFDCEHVNEGWDADMDAVADRQKPGKNGARDTFEEAVPDIELDNQPQHIPVSTICEDEQVFYERHYETLQRTNETNGRQGTGTSNSRPGVVGPLSVSTAAIDMMRVGVERETENGRTGRNKDLTLDKNLMSNKNVNTNGAQSPNTTMVSSPVSAAAAAAAAANGGSPLNNGAQNGPSHEVLANFFQSLLSKKASTGNASPTTATSPTSSLLNGGSGGVGGGGSSGGGVGGQSNGKSDDHTTTYRRPTISRKEVHKELDRMRQFTTSK